MTSDAKPPQNNPSSQEHVPSEDSSPSQDQTPRQERFPLEELYPACFDWRKPKPLKIGIHQDLIADGHDRIRVRRALGAYCSRPSYHRAMHVGVTRIDLSGQPAGVVAEEDVELAKASLQKHSKSAHVADMLPGDTPVPPENRAPGRLEVTVKFSELPETQPIQDGMKIGVPTQEAMVWVDLKTKVWHRLEHAEKTWPQWLAIINGALDRLEDGTLILKRPILQVFERKPRPKSGNR